jgi:hypothetical protein
MGSISLLPSVIILNSNFQYARRSEAAAAEDQLMEYLPSGPVINQVDFIGIGS